jgi:hypothetical protein
MILISIRYPAFSSENEQIDVPTIWRNSDMKKIVTILGLVAIMGALVTGVAFAQGGEPPEDGAFGRRTNSNPQAIQLELDGTMHDDLLTAVSAATGIRVSELESRIEAGESMAAIFISEGLDIALLTDIMNNVRSETLAELVADGTISQDQASWMLDRQANNIRAIGDCTLDGSQIRRQGLGSAGRAARRGK